MERCAFLFSIPPAKSRLPGGSDEVWNIGIPLWQKLWSPKVTFWRLLRVSKSYLYCSKAESRVPGGWWGGGGGGAGANFR